MRQDLSTRRVVSHPFTHNDKKTLATLKPTRRRMVSRRTVLAGAAAAIAATALPTPALASGTINATAVWRIRPNGNTLNGGGFDSAIAGAGTDYSKQDAAWASASAGSGAGTSTFTDLTANFNAAGGGVALIGNCLNIVGQGFWFITAVPTATTLTIAGTLGTFSGAAWKLGGGWGGAANDTLTANIKSTGPCTTGNTVFILGSGTPVAGSYGSPDYTCTTVITPAGGPGGTGVVWYKADPATPGYNSTNPAGMPLISAAGQLFANQQYIGLRQLWIFSTAAAATRGIIDTCHINTQCVFDQNGYDIAVLNDSVGNGIAGTSLLSEFFSSHAARGTTVQAAIYCDHPGPPILCCNIHNTNGPGIVGNQQPRVYYTIIAKCGGDGILVTSDAVHSVYHAVIQNCTIDGNTGNGITISNVGDAGVLMDLRIFNCFITNNTAYGIGCNFGTVAANDLAKGFVDYNCYYLNSSGDLQNLSYGPHDTLLSASPYADQTHQNYTPATLTAGGTPNNAAISAPSFSTAYAVFRARPSGNNLNGGGYNVSASVVASGSNASLSGNTLTDTVFGAFTTGMIGASILISGVGQYNITARPTASTLTLGSGVPTELRAGAAYNWMIGTGDDYSQQDSPQVTFDGTVIAAHTSGVTTTIILTGYTVAATDTNNVVQITGGTNFTAGFYTIQSVNVGLNTWTFDRNCTSGIGTGMIGRMGGGWGGATTLTANFAQTGPIVPGNIIYILGSGIPNPASYTFDYTQNGSVTVLGGNATAGYYRFKGDPATPNFATGGMPCIKTLDALMFFDNGDAQGKGPALYGVEDMWVVCGGTNNHKSVLSGGKYLKNVTFDQNGFDCTFANAAGTVIGCEFFSTAAIGGASHSAIQSEHYGGQWSYCNFHDTVYAGCSTGNSSDNGQVSMTNCLVAKTRSGPGIYSQSPNAGYYQIIALCTVDGNAGAGLTQADTKTVSVTVVFDNLFTNNGTYGIDASGGTSQAANDQAVPFCDWNCYRANVTAATASLTLGVDDTAIASDPYIGQSTENYTLKAGVLGAKQALPAAPFPQHTASQVAPTNFLVPGGAQTKPAVSTAYVYAFPNAKFPQNVQTPSTQSYMLPGAVQLAGAQPIRNRGMIFG